MLTFNLLNLGDKIADAGFDYLDQSTTLAIAVDRLILARSASEEMLIEEDYISESPNRDL